MPGTKWLRIESAPKDGSLVLAWTHVWDRPAWVRWGANPRNGRVYWQDSVEQDSDENEIHPPTHWFPLPPLPPKKG